MIYAIDPGPHTGVFWIDALGKPRRLTFDYTVPEHEGLKLPHRHLYSWLLATVNPVTDWLVCESFEYRKEDAKNREYIDYSPGELVGVVKLFAQLTTTPLYMQMASQAKGFWKDDKLKRVELFVPGDSFRHVRDATRHWLHFTSFVQGDQSWLLKLRR